MFSIFLSYIRLLLPSGAAFCDPFILGFGDKIGFGA
jgi:hypothetical protein